jgi:hypothetical protein
MKPRKNQISPISAHKDSRPRSSNAILLISSLPFAIAESSRKNRASDEQLEQFAKEIQELISGASEKTGIKMIRYIY